ncbi:CHAT domain-containing protein (plasmid) [Novosphingobium sp. EMRT-2]|nr:CHAT domain-containing protein [Novosphingobium sp. EMRT-2]
MQTTPGCAQIRQAMIVPKWASSTRFDALVSSDPASNPGALNAEAAKLAADKTEAARLFADLGLRADPEAVADIVLYQAQVNLEASACQEEFANDPDLLKNVGRQFAQSLFLMEFASSAGIVDASNLDDFVEALSRKILNLQEPMRTRVAGTVVNLKGRDLDPCAPRHQSWQKVVTLAFPAMAIDWKKECSARAADSSSPPQPSGAAPAPPPLAATLEAVAPITLDCPPRPDSAAAVADHLDELAKNVPPSADAILRRLDAIDRSSCLYQAGDLPTRADFVRKRRAIILQGARKAQRAGQYRDVAQLLLGGIERERPWLPGADALNDYGGQIISLSQTCQWDFSGCALPPAWPHLLEAIGTHFALAGFGQSPVEVNGDWAHPAFTFVDARSAEDSGDYAGAKSLLDQLLSPAPDTVVPWIGPVPTSGMVRLLMEERSLALGGDAERLGKILTATTLVSEELNKAMISPKAGSLKLFLHTARERRIGADHRGEDVTALGALFQALTERLKGDQLSADETKAIGQAAAQELIPYVKNDREQTAEANFAMSMSVENAKNPYQAAVWMNFSGNASTAPTGMDAINLAAWYIDRSDWPMSQDYSRGLGYIAAEDAQHGLDLLAKSNASSNDLPIVEALRLHATRNLAVLAASGSDLRLNALLSLPPEDQEDWYYRERDLALEYRSRGDLPEAEKWARFHLAHPSDQGWWDNTAAHVLLADIVFQEGKTDEAAQLIAEVDKSGKGIDPSIMFDRELEERLRVRLALALHHPDSALERAIQSFDQSMHDAEAVLSDEDDGVASDETMARSQARLEAFQVRPLMERRRWAVSTDYISDNQIQNLIEVAAAQPVRQGRKDGDSLSFIGAQRLIGTRASDTFYRAALRESLPNIPARANARCGKARLEALLRRGEDAAERATSAGEAANAGSVGVLAARDDLRTRFPGALGAAEAADEADADNRALRSETALCIPSFAQIMDARPVSIEEVQARLGPHEGVLVLVPAAQDVFVYAITKDKSALVDAGPVKRLGGLVTLLLCELDRAKCARLDPKLALTVRDPARLLYSLIFPPLGDTFDSVDTLYTVGGGPFSAIPFAVLRTGDRNGDWLAERFALITLPGVANLKPFGPQMAVSPRESHFFGAGNPVPPADLTASAVVPGNGAKRSVWAWHDQGRLRIGFAALPGTALELNALKDIFGAAKSHVLMGLNATEAAVRQSPFLRNAEVVEFATHGFLAGDAGMAEPGLVFTPPERPSADDDGYLSASEVATLRLRARFVILSACNTAGDAAASENLSGLARSFLFAGAQALLVSRWRLSDQAASLLTVEAMLAQREDPTLTKAAALQRAMHNVRTGRRQDGTELQDWTPDLADPFAWGPFELVADRNVP